MTDIWPSSASTVTKALLAMPEYQAARRISVYLSMPAGEINTSGIVADALARGKSVFIPYTYPLSDPRPGQPKSIMDMLQLHSLADLASLEADRWGIPMPRSESLPARANCFGGTGITDGQAPSSDSSACGNGLDLIIMPGMAFDSGLGRLGHGKGFYDYFLTRCHQTSGMPFRGKNSCYLVCRGLTDHDKVGLSLTEQFLAPTEAVPMGSSDFRLDALITGDGTLHRAEA